MPGLILFCTNTAHSSGGPGVQVTASTTLFISAPIIISPQLADSSISASKVIPKAPPAGTAGVCIQTTKSVPTIVSVTKPGVNPAGFVTMIEPD